MPNNKGQKCRLGFCPNKINLAVYTDNNKKIEIMDIKKRKISIIGSTGSIGTQALEVIEKLQDKFEIIALAGGHCRIVDKAGGKI